jgi:hypothetical protein
MQQLAGERIENQINPSTVGYLQEFIFELYVMGVEDVVTRYAERVAQILDLFGASYGSEQCFCLCSDGLADLESGLSNASTRRMNEDTL